MQEWLLLGALFLLVLGVTMSLLRWNEQRRRRTSRRYDETAALDDGDSKPSLVLGKMTPAFAEQIPISEEDRSQLERDLRDAGFYKPSAVTEYTAIRTLLLIAPVVLAGLIAVVAPRSAIPYILIVGVVLAVLGFSIPRFYLHQRARRRRREIERSLPIAVDLLTLSLSGGQTVLGALDRVSRELHFSHPVMAEELEIVLHQSRLTSLKHALQQLALRVRVPEVRNLVIILTQTERLGTDLATGLTDFSTTYRTSLRQRADATANRVSFMMLFPTILGLWIPAAVLLVAPIAFEFKNRRSDGKQAMDRSAPRRQAAMERNQNRDKPNAPGKTADPLAGMSGVE